MLSDKKIRKIEEAKSNILRGNDIESAALILERCILDNCIIKGGRVNILRVATRQILTFIENAKNKSVFGSMSSFWTLFLRIFLYFY